MQNMYHSSSLKNDAVFSLSENAFDSIKSNVWMYENWHYSIIMSVFYIFAKRFEWKLMKSRKPCRLDFPLWNLGLALFSIMGVVLMIPELYLALISLSSESCRISVFQSVAGYWLEMFALFKIGECVDTIFIGFRKQKWHSPHSYYQIAVLFYIWYPFATSTGRWLISLDYVVHAFMYSYFVIRTFISPVPVFLRKIVIFLQLSQMILAVHVGIYIWEFLFVGFPCQHTWPSLYFCFSIYVLYFGLFWKLKNAYLTKNDHDLNKDKDDLMVARLAELIYGFWKSICRMFQKLTNWSMSYLDGFAFWLVSKFGYNPTIAFRKLAKLKAEIYVMEEYLRKGKEVSNTAKSRLEIHDAYVRRLNAFPKFNKEFRKLKIDDCDYERPASNWIVSDIKLNPALERRISEMVERCYARTDKIFDESSEKKCNGSQD